MVFWMTSPLADRYMNIFKPIGHQVGYAILGRTQYGGGVMEFLYTNLQPRRKTTGTVVVIDVFKALSTAYYAFSVGVDYILLVSTLTEAFLL